MKKIHKSLADKSSLELAQLLSKAALEKKAEDLVILDVRGISSFADYFVIMSGRSTRHVQGLADAIGQNMSKKRMTQGKVEGITEGHWVLLDYNDVVVHIFYHESREFYDLEGLWHDAPRVEVE
ncbi:MAG: ribosome silencing factor [Proteobacteria bacterium]|jgi:ribosome-associated protein|nr:ribosome silencing factor [Pseudomonadota bacterium]MBU1639491.1 ribosome silencing factor [Pseudomonadota bacterium]